MCIGLCCRVENLTDSPSLLNMIGVQSTPGYMLFASRNGEEELLDMGSRRQKIVSSSYLGELDALVCACKRPKAFRGSIPVVVRTDNHALVKNGGLTVFTTVMSVFSDAGAGWWQTNRS